MADDRDKEKGGVELKTPLSTQNPWEFVVVAGIIAVVVSYAVANFLGFLQSNPFLRAIGFNRIYTHHRNLGVI